MLEQQKCIKQKQFPFTPEKNKNLKAAEGLVKRSFSNFNPCCISWFNSEIACFFSNGNYDCVHTAWHDLERNNGCAR